MAARRPASLRLCASVALLVVAVSSLTPSSGQFAHQASFLELSLHFWIVMRRHSPRKLDWTENKKKEVWNLVVCF